MITDGDITKLKEVFATKEDLADVREELADVKVELGEVHEKIDTVATAVGRIENTLDGIVGANNDVPKSPDKSGALCLQTEANALTLSIRCTKLVAGQNRPFS